jgi:hypothetical protein
MRKMDVIERIRREKYHEEFRQLRKEKEVKTVYRKWYKELKEKILDLTEGEFESLMFDKYYKECLERDDLPE